MKRAIADGRLELAAAGAWSASHARLLDGITAGAVSPPLAGITSVRLDASAIEAFDTYGAWLLARLQRHCAQLGYSVDVTGLSPERLRLYDTVRESADAEPTVETAAAGPHLGAPLVRLGRLGDDIYAQAREFLTVLGAFAVNLLAALKAPRTFRLTSMVHQLDRVGWRAVPIILLITFLIGGIIAQQGFFHFRKFGADAYVVDMVGILVLREIGVLIVSIMVAGRSGSSYTAELGSMKMREEIDALRTMGFDPVAVLVVPRVLALVIALPLLTFLGSMAALYGGAVIASTYGGMSFDIFVTRLKEAISLTHFKVGMIKAPFMALVIGIVSCTEGLKVRGSAESLGLHTTASVVKSIFLVIVLDGCFAIFFAAIGM